MNRNNKKLNSQLGLSPLFAILIISAAAMLMVVNFAYIGQNDLEVTNASDRGQDAYFVAQSCLNDGLMRVKKNNSYLVSSSTLSINGGSCTMNVTASATDRIIKVFASSSSGYKEMSTSVYASSGAVVIYDWQEY